MTGPDVAQRAASPNVAQHESASRSQVSGLPDERMRVSGAQQPAGAAREKQGGGRGERKRSREEVLESPEELLRKTWASVRQRERDFEAVVGQLVSFS